MNMEDKKSGMMKHAMTYGAIIGLSLIVYSTLLYIAGQTFNKTLEYFQYAILLVGIYIGIKVYRDKSLDGFISYGNALGLGVLITVFVGIITVFFSFIMMRYIDPGLVDKYMLAAEEQLENSRFVNEDQIDIVLERSRKMVTAVWSIPIGVITFTFIGFILSLIVAVILKKEGSPFIAETTIAETPAEVEVQGGTSKVASSRLNKNLIASVVGVLGGGVFFILNAVTDGAVPGGFQGGMLGFLIGYGLAWLVLAFIKLK
jgi:hypothetical protein